MYLDPRHLAQLSVVVEVGSFQAAANRIGVTQPALSRNMRTLELRLGTPLFRREGRRSVPTALGLRLARSGLKIRLAEQQASAAADQSLTGSVGELRIGAPPIIAGRFLTEPLSVFIQHHPGCNIELHTGLVHELRAMLERGQIDLVFGPQILADLADNLVFTPLIDDRVGIMCRSGHLLTQRESILPADLEAQVWLAHSHTAWLHGTARPPHANTCRCAVAYRVCPPRRRNSGALVAPPFTYGYKSHQKSGGGNFFPGTTSLDGASLVNALKDVVKEFVRHGVRDVCIVNGHFENSWFITEAIDLALRELGWGGINDVKVMVLSYWDFVDQVSIEKLYPDGFLGWDIEHGGVLETSLMLRLHPDLVSLKDAVEHAPATFPPYDIYPAKPEWTPESGTLSSPKDATAEKGDILLDVCTRGITDALTTEFARKTAAK